MRLQRREPHLLTGAYAADALAGAELARFERHLDRCSSCAEEVRELRETAARMGLASTIAPPAAMRQQVLRAANRTRQLPPFGRGTLMPGAPRQRARLRRPLTAVAVTAMAAAIVVLAFLQAATQHSLQRAQSANQAIAAVLTAPDARIETRGTTVGGTVTAVISPRDHEAVITASGLPAAPASRVYQLWVISISGARSAGLMPGISVGVTPPVLAAGLQPGDRLGITIEPAGGTARPTTTPVVLLSALS